MESSPILTKLMELDMNMAHHWNYLSCSTQYIYHIIQFDFIECFTTTFLRVSHHSKIWENNCSILKVFCVHIFLDQNILKENSKIPEYLTGNRIKTKHKNIIQLNDKTTKTNNIQMMITKLN